MLQVFETERYGHGERPSQPDGGAAAVQLRHAARVSHFTLVAVCAQLLSEHLPAAEVGVVWGAIAKLHVSVSACGVRSVLRMSALACAQRQRPGVLV